MKAMTARGTGKTLAMVKALPATGAIVVVHASGLREYVEKMIRDTRGADVAKRTKVVCCNRRDLADGYLTGCSLPVFVDHAFVDHVPHHVEARVRMLARGCNLVAGHAILDAREQR